MRALRNMTLGFGMLTLAGCTAFTSFSEVEALNDAKAVGSPFTQALATEYRNFSNTELKDNFDYPDALHFARKGLSAAAGDTVLPEPVSDWNLSEDAIKELGAARGRLITAFDQGARESNPELAAQAQARFDCWIENQEENWKDGAVQKCKGEFEQIMTKLETGVQAPAVTAAPAGEPGLFGVDASKPMTAENAMYLIFFNWDSYELGSGALSVLDDVGQEVAKNPPESLMVVGHTDTSGPKTYNKRLALKRANAARDALAKRGVDQTTIMVDAKGEDELLVPTPDNVREPANRRVNISFK